MREVRAAEHEMVGPRRQERLHAGADRGLGARARRLPYDVMALIM